MKRRDKQKAAKLQPVGEMNTTPLIDVMLVLLVMLIITIPIQLHSVDMNMPTGKPPAKLTEPVVVKLDVDERGQITWNGEALPDHRALEQRMKDSVALAEQPEFHIRPNSKTDYDRIAAILASAQRIGLLKLGIVGNEQYAK